jgi:hypothetical protein
MGTISENLQIIADSTDAIKQAIIDKGGTIEGNITTWASAISAIESGGSGESLPTNIISSPTANEDNAKIYEYLSSLSVFGTGMGPHLSISISNNEIQVCNGVGCTYLQSDGTCYINLGEY